MIRMVARSALAAAAAAAVVVVVGQDAPESSPRAQSTAETAAAVTPTPETHPAPSSPTEPARDPSPGATPAVSPVLAVLEQLPVKGRAPKTGYDRDQFGPAWADVDGNGCDTRNDVLARDLIEVVLDADGCTVRSGLLADPYSRTWIPFVRGEDTSELVQIDHVVALSDAWQKGAQQLSPEQREQLANDPLNLLAVDGALNQQKSGGDAATWLPPNKGLRCEMVARQVAVKARYDLWVTQAEKDAITRVLSACPDQPLPTEAAPVGVVPDGAPPAAGSQLPATEADNASAGDVVFANCTQAREAGAAPLREGEPSYRPRLDGDGDGVACE